MSEIKAEDLVLNMELEQRVKERIQQLMREDYEFFTILRNSLINDTYFQTEITKRVGQKMTMVY